MRVFREAKPGTPAWQVGKTLLQTCVFWGLFLFAMPAGIAALENRLGVPPLLERAPWIGGILFALGGCLGLVSGVTMAVLGDGTPLPIDTARRLVVRGPYRWVCNPMAVAGIVQGLAVGLYRGSIGVVLYALLGAVLWHVAVRPCEERDLRARFGGEYEDYRRNVHCWWPQWRRVRPQVPSGRGR